MRSTLRVVRGAMAAATIALALAMAGPRVLALAVGAADVAVTATAVSDVVSVGMTVGDMDRAVDFYTRVLPFRKIYETEASGRPWEQLHGVFGARVRVVGLQLGDERLELTEYLAPRGRPMPADTRGNDRWFQHVAIIVRDMDRAYAHLKAHGVVHASTAPQRLPDWNPGAGGIQAFYFRDPTGTSSRCSPSLPARATRSGTRPGPHCSSASTTPRSSSPTPTARSPSIATRWVCASSARARTTASSRNT